MSLQSIKAAGKIREDLTDRIGLKREWEQIDGYVRAETVATWARLIDAEYASWAAAAAENLRLQMLTLERERNQARGALRSVLMAINPLRAAKETIDAAWALLRDGT